MGNSVLLNDATGTRAKKKKNNSFIQITWTERLIQITWKQRDNQTNSQESRILGRLSLFKQKDYLELKNNVTIYISNRIIISLDPTKAAIYKRNLKT